MRDFTIQIAGTDCRVRLEARFELAELAARFSTKGLVVLSEQKKAPGHPMLDAVGPGALLLTSLVVIADPAG